MDNIKWYAYVASGIALVTDQPIESESGCLDCRDKSHDILVIHGTYKGYWSLPPGAAERVKLIANAPQLLRVCKLVTHNLYEAATFGYGKYGSNAGIWQALAEEIESLIREVK
jgi:hypothetical protein